MATCILFADESGMRELTAPPPPYFVYAGVIAQSSAVTTLERQIRQLKVQYFGTSDVEIKSNWLRIPDKRAKNYLKPHSITEERLQTFTEQVYRWITRSPITLLASVIDKGQLQSQYINPHNPSAIGYTLLMQRYQIYASARRLSGSVVLDDISGATAAGNAWVTLLKRQHRLLKRDGCPYTRTRFPNLAEQVEFADSKQRQLIQIADLVAYNTLRQFVNYGDEWDDPNGTSLPLYEYFARIVSKFDVNGRGVFGGCGVAKMPRRANHAWLLPA